MDFITGNDFDNIFLTGADGQLTDEVSEAAGLAGPGEEERIRYEQVVRELTEFEVAHEGSTDYALDLPTRLGGQPESGA